MTIVFCLRIAKGPEPYWSPNQHSNVPSSSSSGAVELNPNAPNKFYIDLNEPGNDD